MSRVLVVCGSRVWTDEAEVREQMARLHACERYDLVATGGCPRGADAMAERAAETMGLPVRRFDPDWARLGRAAGVVRNAEMLADCRPTRVLALASPNLEQSRGTADTVRRARQRRIPVTLVEPDA